MPRALAGQITARGNPSWTWHLPGGLVVKAFREPVFEWGLRSRADTVRYSVTLTQMENTIDQQHLVLRDVGEMADYETEGEAIAEAMPSLPWFDEDDRRFLPAVAAGWASRGEVALAVEEGATRARQRARKAPEAEEGSPSFRLLPPEPEGKGHRLTWSDGEAEAIREVQRELTRRRVQVPLFFAIDPVGDFDYRVRRASRELAEAWRLADRETGGLIDETIDLLAAGVPEDVRMATVDTQVLARELADEEANERAAVAYATDYETQWLEDLANEFGVDTDDLAGLIVAEFGDAIAEGPGDAENVPSAPDTSKWIELEGHGGRVPDPPEEEIILDFLAEGIHRRMEEKYPGVLTEDAVMEIVRAELEAKEGREYVIWQADSGRTAYYWKPARIPVVLDNSTVPGLPAGKVRVALVPTAMISQRSRLIEALTDYLDPPWPFLHGQNGWAAADGAQDIDDADDLADDLEGLGFDVDVSQWS